ncbi:MAG: response regulator transcription factor [Ruminococcus sp.]|nr:response regulator transcription factor [Ruminococcus sp.]
MRIAVCDDDKVFAPALRERLEAIGGLDMLVTVFNSGSELVRAVEAGDPLDAVFLDIEMPGLDGLEAAKKLRSRGSELQVIFLTSHTELAMEGYEVDALRFLPKDCSDRKLVDALEAVKRELKIKPNVIIRQHGEETVIPPDDIILAESDNNNVTFVTLNGCISARMKLTEALVLLEGASQDFVRVHRCIIVNLRHVKKYSAKEILLDSGETVPVSKGYAGEFRQRMLGFLRLSAR